MPSIDLTRLTDQTAGALRAHGRLVRRKFDVREDTMGNAEYRDSSVSRPNSFPGDHAHASRRHQYRYSSSAALRCGALDRGAATSGRFVQFSTMLVAPLSSSPDDLFENVHHPRRRFPSDENIAI